MWSGEATNFINISNSVSYVANILEVLADLAVKIASDPSLLFSRLQFTKFEISDYDWMICFMNTYIAINSILHFLKYKA